MTAVWIVIANGMTLAAMAVLTQWLRGRERRAERQERRAERDEDSARLRAVADRAAEAAEKVEGVAVRTAEAAAKVETVAVQAAEAASLLVASTDRAAETNQRVAETTARNEAKIDQVHVMLNNERTVALKDKLDEQNVKLALLREIVRLNPAADMRATIEATEASIAKLEAEIATREEQERTAARVATAQ